MIKINLGCGKDYRKGWINVDFNKEVKADVYADLTKKLPFKNDYADIILLDNVIEHIRPDYYFDFLEELHRICRKGAIIHIYAPHFSGIYALKHPTHYKFFGIGSLDFLRPKELFNAERYTKARFELREERLLFFHHNLANFTLLSRLPINWIFNFGRVWQQIMERFQIFGFDEIYYKIEAIKNKQI